MLTYNRPIASAYNFINLPESLRKILARITPNVLSPSERHLKSEA